MPEDGTHHHSLLAGVGAGAMAVLVFGIGLLWMVWHRIAGAVGTAGTAIVIAVTVLVVASCGYGVLCLVVRGTQHVRHPETVTGKVTLRRGVQPAPPPPVLQSQPVTELPAGGTVIHNHFDSPDAGAAILRALQGPPDAPR
jgi:hypothetical protein